MGATARPHASEARSFLQEVALLPVDDAVLEEAASIEPARLRSVDALHLATALSVREDIGAFLTYDDRLAEAVGERGLNVVRPV